MCVCVCEDFLCADKVYLPERSGLSGQINHLSTNEEVRRKNMARKMKLCFLHTEIRENCRKSIAYLYGFVQSPNEVKKRVRISKAP